MAMRARWGGAGLEIVERGVGLLRQERHARTLLGDIIEIATVY